MTVKRMKASLYLPVGKGRMRVTYSDDIKLRRYGPEVNWDAVEIVAYSEPDFILIQMMNHRILDTQDV